MFIRAVNIPVRRPMTLEERRMGLFSVTVRLHSLLDDSFTDLSATVDTGANFSMIPANVLDDLGVERAHRAAFELADGSRAEYDVGELRVTVEGQTTHTWAGFAEVGTEPLLGCYAMDGLMLAADPYAGKLILSPDAPPGQNGLQL